MSVRDLLSGLPDNPPLHSIARDRDGTDGKLLAVRSLRTLLRYNDAVRATIQIISENPARIRHGRIDHAKSCALDRGRWTFIVSSMVVGSAAASERQSAIRRDVFARSVQLPTVGRLKRGWGKWHGQLPVAQLPEPLDLVIEVPRSEPVEPFAELAALFAATFGQLREDFADELFESYQFYKKADLDAGGFTETDFAEHPAVRSREDVWTVLRPYRLCLFSPPDRQMGNSYLLVDVDWPNSHFFQLFMKASAEGFEYVHTEFVG